MEEDNFEWKNHPIIPGRYCCFKNPFNPVTHVIFDLDGTILETESINDKVFTEILIKFGKKWTDEIHEAILGTNEFDLCKTICRMCDLPIEPEELQKIYQEENYKLIENAKIMPGAEKLITHLYQHQIPLAIATSSSDESVEHKISQKRTLFDMFGHIVRGSSDPEVLQGKPKPNIYYIAARRFIDRPLRKNCLVFEDSVNGLRAALAAGMQTVMVPDDKISYDKWKYATLRLDSLEQFIPELFGLPAF